MMSVNGSRQGRDEQSSRPRQSKKKDQIQKKAGLVGVEQRQLKKDEAGLKKETSMKLEKKKATTKRQGKPKQETPKPKKPKKNNLKQAKAKGKGASKVKKIKKQKTIKQPISNQHSNQQLKIIKKFKKLKKPRKPKKLTLPNLNPLHSTISPQDDKLSEKASDLYQSSEGTSPNYEVKLQFSESDSQQESTARQSYIAKRLHAYRDELQVMEIDDTDQTVKSFASLSSKQPDNEIDIPTDDQISYLISLLEEKYPQRDNERVLQMLYKCLVKKDSEGNDCISVEEQLLKAKDSSLNQKYTKLIKNLQTNLRVLSEKSEKSVIKRYIKNPRSESTFQREEDRVKFQEKQVIAKAFCNREYGMPALLEELRQSASRIIIERNRYKTLVTCVVSEAYRKLQDFLIEQCGREINPLNREQIRSIYTTLLNCRTNFDTEQCLTFLKFMKLAFELQSVTVTDQSAIKLYIVIQKALKLRLGEMQLDRMYDTMRCNKEFKARRSFQHERFQIHRIWTNELEQEFLRFYKNNQEFAKIRDHFKGKYREHQHLYTIDSLRSRFNKIMRMALRKTGCFCEKFGQDRVPRMVKLNDLKVKFLLRSPEALNARLLLVEMYLNDECEIGRLYQTVSAVNEFIIMKDNERMNQMIEAEPMFSSAEAKIHHNVALSKTKLKTKEKDEGLYYKGRESTYDHIVQKTDGESLHYYRKPESSQSCFSGVKGQKLKMQEGRTSVATQEAVLPSVAKRSGDQVSRSSCGSEGGSGMLEMMIREEIGKYGKSQDVYSGYR